MARILIVDDEALVRAGLRRLLTRAGHETHEACEGNEALRLQREHPADLVITDMVMPEKDGVEVVMQLRREYPKTKIVAISGGGRVSPDTYLSNVQLLGADRIFSKPVGSEELLTAIRELLGPD